MNLIKIFHFGLLIAALFAAFSGDLLLATFFVSCATYLLFHAVAAQLTVDE
jgi:hypothetical protein